MKDAVAQMFDDYGCNLTKFSIDRDHEERGIPSWLISVEFRTLSEEKYWAEWTFARGNHMSEEHMLKVIDSYLNSSTYVERSGRL